MTLEGMVVVREKMDRLDAGIIAAFLRAQGIEASVSSDDAGGTLPSFEESLGVQILVKSADEKAARQALRAQEAAFAASAAAEAAAAGAGEPAPEDSDGVDGA